MGACKTKPKDTSHHNHKQPPKTETVGGAKTDVKIAEGERKIIGSDNHIVKSQMPNAIVNSTQQPMAPVVTVQHKIKFVIANQPLHEGTYESNRSVASILSELNNKLKGRDYDLLLLENGNKKDITKSSNEPLNKLLPQVSGSFVIELSYAGLELPEDAREAYIKACKFLASPKYESSPFEMVIFNIAERLPINHYFPEEHFKILTSLSNFSAYCNGVNKIFFSGGEIKNSEEILNLFVEVDLINLTSIKRLPDLNVARSWHSMIFIPSKYIFIVGGKNTKSVEMYDLQKNTLIQHSNLNALRGEASLCLVNNSYLYVFGGFIYNDKYPLNFERCDLRKRNQIWEYVNIKNLEIFEPSFFSVCYGKSNTIILLGDREHPDCMNKSYLYKLNENGEDELSLYEPQREEEPYSNSEKFFIPCDPNKSFLLPLFNSEVVKLLIYDCSYDKGILTMQKSEILETAAEEENRNPKEIVPSVVLQNENREIVSNKNQMNLS